MKEQFRCSRCGSDDTMSVPVAYAAGTKSLSISGVGMGLDGELILSGGSGTAQTGLAASLTPPPRKDVNGPTALLAVAAVTTVACIMCVLGVRTLYPIKVMECVLGFGGLLLIPLALRMRSKAIAYNIGVWPKLQGTWEREWMCRRCGSLFLPDSDAPPASSEQDRPIDPVESLEPMPAPVINIDEILPQFSTCRHCGKRLKFPPGRKHGRCPQCNSEVFA